MTYENKTLNQKLIRFFYSTMTLLFLSRERILGSHQNVTSKCNLYDKANSKAFTSPHEQCEVYKIVTRKGGFEL